MFDFLGKYRVLIAIVVVGLSLIIYGNYLQNQHEQQKDKYQLVHNYLDAADKFDVASLELTDAIVEQNEQEIEILKAVLKETLVLQETWMLVIEEHGDILPPILHTEFRRVVDEMRSSIDDCCSIALGKPSGGYFIGSMLIYYKLRGQMAQHFKDI